MRTLNRRHTFAAFLVPLIICLPSNLPAQNPVGSPGNLEGGIGLLLGGKAQYLKEGSVTVSRSSGRVYYDTIESTTDMLTGQLGVSVVF